MRRFPWRRLSIVALGLACSLASSARAQLRRDTSGVWLPPTSYAAPDDAFALSLNPAALAFVDDWTVSYVHADAGNEDRVRPEPIQPAE